jgi:tRNA nucleotidyltransferase (CCA-adding enzyme)
MSIDMVVELLRYGGRDDDANELAAWDVPRCPVNGGDLIKAGFAKGPQLGNTLNGIREMWIASNYTMTKQELLASVPDGH